jgi:predicted Zn-dependent protease
MINRVAARPAVGLSLALALCAASACATNPASGKKEIVFITEAQEIEMGREGDQEIRREMSIYDDPALQRYVEDIGMRLARTSHRPNLPWQFTVLDVAAVNAFALPGGFVYITRGLLPYLSSEADLAGVLGHEIGHVTARHAVQQQSKAAGAQLGLLGLGIFVPSTQPFSSMADFGLQSLFLKYGRDDELEADRLGAEYAARQEWDPRGVREMLTSLARLDEAADRRGIPNWLSTHPAPADRVAKISQAVDEAARARADWVVDRDRYLSHLDGLIVGDDPEDGVVRDNLFLHPSLRVSVTFPQDWTINNGEEQVVARNPSADEYVVMQLVARPEGTSIQEIASRDAQKRRLKAGGSGRAAQPNGNDAYIEAYSGKVAPLGAASVLGAHLKVGRRVVFLAGIAKPETFKAASPTFEAVFQSVRELSAREASALRPNVIAFYTVQSGDSWQSIAARQGHNIVRATTLAIMNGHAVTEQPQPGERVKIVVEGK